MALKRLQANPLRLRARRSRRFVVRAAAGRARFRFDGLARIPASPEGAPRRDKKRHSAARSYEAGTAR